MNTAVVKLSKRNEALGVEPGGRVLVIVEDQRVCYGIPTPDAIHLGTALAHGAGAFVTNDARLQRVTEMDVLLLSEFI